MRDGLIDFHILRTPNQGMTAAGAQPPGPRLPINRGAPESCRAQRRKSLPIVAARCCCATGSAAWAVTPERATFDDVRRGATSREETGRRGRKELIKRNQGLGPSPDELGRRWRKRGRAASRKRHSKVETRTGPFISGHPCHRGASVSCPHPWRSTLSARRPARAYRPDDSHPSGRFRCCLSIRSPDYQASLESPIPASWG
jgi:hypothetical protein